MTQPLNIVFAGTPEFAAVTLRALLASTHRVVAVYTQPDRPAGRGRQLTAGPVKALAVERGIPVHQPLSLKDPEQQRQLAALHPDVMVVVAYGLILPAAVLAIPRLGCLNIHGSLLPRWRGAAPIQRALLAGDAETGVTIMQMDVGLDTGPILQVARCPITAADTSQTLYEQLAALGAQALLSVLTQLSEGTARAAAQDNNQANYAAKIDKAEGRMDWSQPAVKLDRQVRAFNPWPVAFAEFGKETLRIWSTQLIDGPLRTTPGTVIAAGKSGIDVATGDGILRLLTVQAPGGKALAAGDFLNAHRQVTAGFQFSHE